MLRRHFLGMANGSGGLGIVRDTGPPSCQRIPDRTDTNTVIFVGVVSQVVTPVFTPPPPSPLGSQPPGIARTVGGRGDPVSQVEFQYSTARLEVLENFLGAGAAEFEVRLTRILNGIPQQVPSVAEGEVWFIEAYKGSARSAVDGQLPRAVETGGDCARGSKEKCYRRVSTPPYSTRKRGNTSRVSICVRSAKQTFSTVTELAGRFTFQDLPDEIYEASAALPQQGGPLRIDLTPRRRARNGCLPSDNR